MKVVIYGLRGVGIETAKNLSLQAVGSLTLIEDKKIEIKDVGVNFFFHKEDIGQSRLAVALKRLEELNPLCQLSGAENLTEESLKEATALVITQPLPLPRLIELNEYCRKQKVSFFYAQTSGVSADLFVDHGDNHLVYDLDGEKPIQKIITDIQRLSDDELLVRYETPEGQQAIAVDGGAYEVSEVDGIAGINGQIVPVTRVDGDPACTARLLCSLKEDERYRGGGMMKEKKLPVAYPMKSLKYKLKRPGHPFGEPPLQKTITSVERVSDTEILIHYATPPDQLDDAIERGLVTVSGIEGINGLNDNVFEVSRHADDPLNTVRLSYSITEGEVYQNGGILTEKRSHDLPTLVSTDLLNYGAEHQQHVGFYAGLKFFTAKGHMPRVHNEDDLQAMMTIVQELVDQKEVDIEYFEVNESLMKKYIAFLSVELQPLSAFLGGVLAQEVVKCTGKYTPIPGFMHFSAFETLPDDEATLYSTVDKKPRGHENDDLAAVFGWTMLEKVSNLKYFMVGCGALGCELMKNFALNNIFCGPDGRLVVTDADRIELSNLSRQFLFREHNVGQPKSRAASAMAKIMNPNINVEALELFVGPKTENYFDDNFWLNLDGVCNALDNIPARLYIDRQCVKYEKSLLESGTMGTNGIVDTFCPFKTRTYAESGNALTTGGVPMCTLRNFPHLPEHCIEWARDQFELLFANLGKSLQTYREKRNAFELKIADKAASEPGPAFFDLRSLISFARLAAQPSIGNAAQTAFDIFHFLFRDRILDLQNAFPKDFRAIDSKTGEDKGLFWSKDKRYPTVASFNINDESHIDFLQSTTCLLAVVVGLVPNKKPEEDEKWLHEFRSKDWIKNIVQGLKEPEYVAAPVNGNGMQHVPPVDKEALSRTLQGFFNELESVTSNVKEALKGESIDFEKDDDANFHIEFIAACANIRCDNYSIKRTTFQECKVIAGNIIPAIATTTAAVCGLVILELFKLVQGKCTEAYMNRAIGLGGFQYTSFTAEPPNKFSTWEEVSEPGAEAKLPSDAYDEKGKVKEEFLIKKVHRSYPEDHTVWDKLTCSGNLTLAKFNNWLLEKHSLKLSEWNFVLGHTQKTDEEGKKVIVGVSTPVYPPKLALNYSLLPPLDIPLNQAIMKIMRSVPGTLSQQYQTLWKQFKAEGLTEIPPQPAPTVEQSINEETTLRDILVIMNRLAEEKLNNGEIETSTISNVEKRQFVLIASSEAPSCVNVNTNEIVENLCSIKIMLN